MDLHRNPLLASFPCGRIGDTPLRVSLLMAFVLLAIVCGSEPKSIEHTVARKTASASPRAESSDSPIVDLSDSLSEASVVRQTADRQAVETDGYSEADESAVGSSSIATQPSRGPSLSAGRPSVREQVVSTTTNRLTFAVFLAVAFAGSCVLHVLAEIVIAKRAGGSVAGVVLLPVGGLTVLARSTPSIQMVTSAVGLVVHLGLCLLCFPAVILSGQMETFSPLSLPAVSFEDHWFAAAGLLIFSVNWKLTLLCLLPLPPLNGARFIRGWRAADNGSERIGSAWRWAQLGVLAGMGLCGMGVVVNAVWVTALGGFVLAWGCVDFLAFAHREGDEDTEFGHDFSDGYTSLQHDDEREVSVPREKTLGPVARWKAKKEAKKRQREREEREWAEKELDRLLDKVGKVGMDGLTADEKKTLTQVSSRYKQ